MAGKLDMFDTYRNPVLTTKGNEVSIRWDNSLVKSHDDRSILGTFSLGKRESDETSGFVSICSSCKNVRTQDDRWERIESYFAKRFNLTFSHGYCTDCLQEELERIG